MVDNNKIATFSHRKPLAERMRPHNLEDVIGQDKATSMLSKIAQNKKPFSVILWGPAGTGKTTLARIIAEQVESDFIEISAVIAKKSDIEATIERARQNWNLQIKTVLFVDEIHRFNKAQQDAFLPHIESGLISLIGATTENPSFEVITPLLSRSQVIILEPLQTNHITEIIKRASDKEGFSKRISSDAIDMISRLASGDARYALGILDTVSSYLKNTEKITIEKIIELCGQKPPSYDKNSIYHYDITSAFIKSIRGSDEPAALYYLARMIKAGEDPKFIARRLIIFASEDIGLAGNGALGLATNAFLAIERIGLPEGGIVLSHVTSAMCRSKKSRESYDNWRKAEKLADRFPDSPIPLGIKNGVTKLMKDIGYGKNYQWKAGWHSPDSYLPTDVASFLKNNHLEPSDDRKRHS